MKLLCMSDIHCDFAHPNFCPETLPDADLCLIAGDITNNGLRRTAEVEAARDWMRRLSERFPVFWIPGNHDVGVTWETFRDPASPYGNSCLFSGQGSGLRRVTFGKLRLAGVSCSPCYNAPMLAEQWDYSTADREKEQEIYAAVFDCDVLISHAPPAFCEPRLDFGGYVIGEGASYIGSAELTQAIERIRPRVVICGHAHAGAGAGFVGETPVYNVARQSRLIELP